MEPVRNVDSQPYYSAAKTLYSSNPKQHAVCTYLNKVLECKLRSVEKDISLLPYHLCLPVLPCVDPLPPLNSRDFSLSSSLNFYCFHFFFS